MHRRRSGGRAVKGLFIHLFQFARAISPFTHERRQRASPSNEASSFPFSLVPYSTFAAVNARSLRKRKVSLTTSRLRLRSFHFCAINNLDRLPLALFHSRFVFRSEQTITGLCYCVTWDAAARCGGTSAKFSEINHSAADADGSMFDWEISHPHSAVAVLASAGILGWSSTGQE